MAGQLTFLLVHGSWHGPWCWELLSPELEARGYAVRTVALPSMGDDAATLGGIVDDGRVVSEAAAAIAGDVIVVGHSYGGVAISEARFGPQVRRLVYLGAFMPDKGRAFVSYLPPGPLPPYVSLAADGTSRVTPGTERDTFYHDCSAEVASGAARRLNGQSQSILGAENTHAAWREIASTYVVLTRDRVLPPPLLRAFAAQATESVDFDSSHSPMLSRPADLADLLDGVAQRALGKVAVT